MQPAHRSSKLAQPAALFVAAVLVRASLLGYMLHIKAPQQLWTLNEEGMIARSLFVNHSFSSPFHDANGPTAWVAPGYPFLVALVFRIFGIATAASAKAVIGLNALFSAATALLILRIGRRTFGVPTGLLAAWAWALSPYAALLGWLIWETSLSAFLMAYSLWRTLVLEDTPELRNWLYSGACWGITALVNPALATPLPILLAYLLYRSRADWKPPIAMALTFAGVLLPWTIRNEVVFHKLILVRSNAWAEVYFGNAGFDLHPRGPSGLYQRMGEAAYTGEMKQRLQDYIRANPGKFARDAARRIWPFWTAPAYLEYVTIPLLLLMIAGLGFAVRGNGDRIMAFAIVLAFYPLPYYLSHTYARFRFPIEPIMFVLASYAAVRMVQLPRRRHLRP